MAVLLILLCMCVPSQMDKNVAGIRQSAKPTTDQLKIKPVTNIKVSLKKVSIKMAKAIDARKTFGSFIRSPR